MKNELTIEIPKQFKELFNPKWRNICYYGGRSAGKSYSVALALLARSMEKKIRIICVRETQRSIADSVHSLLKSIIERYELPNFEVTQTSIICKTTGSEFIFRGLKQETKDSLKSIPNIAIAWVEEAQSVSLPSIQVLVPTIRDEGSQIIWTFNRDTPSDPVWTEIVEKADENTFVCKINSHDVEKFLSHTIIEEREKMRREDPMMYEHIWLGEPLTAKMGSIYGELLANAREDKRITTVPYDASGTVFTAWDIGVSDSTVVVFAQRINNEIHIIDYYEDSGRALNEYIDVVKQKPYHYEKHILPHDSRQRELQTAKTREDVFRDMGIHNTEVLKPESVDVGISMVRSAFNRLWIDDDKCKRLIECLKAYHYEWDEKNQKLHNTPKHDFSSHSADALRYLISGLEQSVPEGAPIKTFVPNAFRDKEKGLWTS